MILWWLGILEKDIKKKKSMGVMGSFRTSVILIKIKKCLTFMATSRCSISESIPKNLASSSTPIKIQNSDFHTEQFILIFT